MRSSFLRLAVGLLATTSVLAAVGPAARAEGRSIVYMVYAHPDDYVAMWNMVDDYQDDYVVFVSLTKGERVNACLSGPDAATYPHERTLTGEPSSGPYKYEGPGNPVDGQPDEGERHPFGFPWVGQNTEACGDAVVASSHWFLDDVTALDPGFPDFGISSSESGDPHLDDQYKGSFCPPAPNGVANGQPFQDGRHWSPDLGCIEVWGDDRGARVHFDLGDGGWPPSDPAYLNPDPYTVEDVIAAIEAVRANRTRFGFPALPEREIFVAAAGCDPLEKEVLADRSAHRDHEVIHEAVYTHDFGIGAQSGAVCTGDARFAEHPGEIDQLTLSDHMELNGIEPGTNRRLGPVGINFGWLANDAGWDFPLTNKTWTRFGN